jgi:hypothetical protein
MSKISNNLIVLKQYTYFIIIEQVLLNLILQSALIVSQNYILSVIHPEAQKLPRNKPIALTVKTTY